MKSSLQQLPRLPKYRLLTVLVVALALAPECVPLGNTHSELCSQSIRKSHQAIRRKFGSGYLLSFSLLHQFCEGTLLFFYLPARALFPEQSLRKLLGASHRILSAKMLSKAL